VFSSPSGEGDVVPAIGDIFPGSLEGEAAGSLFELVEAPTQTRQRQEGEFGDSAGIGVGAPRRDEPVPSLKVRRMQGDVIGLAEGEELFVLGTYPLAA
jgi:hypothetical protein